ncbi:MAG TPA: sugar ABC transporter permease [Trueperaceae bacterium]
MAQSRIGMAPASRGARKGLRLAAREERMAWLLLLPSVLLLLTVALFPLGRVFYSSFTDARFAAAGSQEVNFVGMRNYRELLSFTLRELPYQVDADGVRRYDHPRLFLRRLDTSMSYDEVVTFDLFGTRYVLGAVRPEFVRSVIDTVIFTVVTVSLETILGMIVALALAAKFFGRNAMRTAMLVPWAIITVVSARIWEWMFRSNRSGFFNSLLDRLGWGDGNTGFLTEPALQLPSIIAIDVWKTTPFMALLLLAGLSVIPKELYEAAEVDGASPIRRFFTITLPLVSPTLAVALVFRTLDALRVFDLFQVVFGERRFSMASFAQYTLVANRDVGLSSAASVVIFLIIFIFAIIYIRALKVDSGD